MTFTATVLARSTAAALLVAAAGCGWLSASPNVSGIPVPGPSATPVATATPVPTATPASSPPGTLAANPSSLAFTNVGNNCGPAGTASCAQSFTVSETNYTGVLNATSSNTAVAMVTAQGAGPSASFTVTPVAAGTATITLADSNAQKTTVSVAVSTTPLTIQNRKTGHE